MAGRHEFKLGEATFYIRKYDAFLSLNILGDLQKRFLGPLAAMLEGQDRAADTETRMKFMMESIDRVSHSLDGDALVALSRKLLNGEFISVAIGGEPAARLDEGLLNRATEDVGDVMALIAEVIKINYASVFTRGRSLIGAGASNTASL